MGQPLYYAPPVALSAYTPRRAAKVHAAKITKMENLPPQTGVERHLVARLHLDNGATVCVTSNFMAISQPREGKFYVVRETGYQTCIDAIDFERDYEALNYAAPQN